jgi:hypothetical protein
VVRVDSGPGRGVALLAVIVLHVGLVAVVALALRVRSDLRTPDVITLTFLDLPPQTPQLRVPPGLPPFAAQPSTAITLPPMTLPEAQGPIDWHAEAQGAATQATGARARSFGRNPATQAAPAPSGPDSAVHHAGEQYRDADGTSVVFVSDHCFIASSPAPLGTPDVIAHGMPTRTVCRGDPGWPRADLFKDLPAYGRYHQQPSPRP